MVIYVYVCVYKVQYVIVNIYVHIVYVNCEYSVILERHFTLYTIYKGMVILYHLYIYKRHLIYCHTFHCGFVMYPEYIFLCKQCVYWEHSLLLLYYIHPFNIMMYQFLHITNFIYYCPRLCDDLRIFIMSVIS